MITVYHKDGKVNVYHSLTTAKDRCQSGEKLFLEITKPNVERLDELLRQEVLNINERIELKVLQQSFINWENL